MRLRILAMGRLRNGPEKDLIEDYVARFSRRGLQILLRIFLKFVMPRPAS
jgi:hypothetical protein